MFIVGGVLVAVQLEIHEAVVADEGHQIRVFGGSAGGLGEEVGDGLFDFATAVGVGDDIDIFAAIAEDAAFQHG